MSLLTHKMKSARSDHYGKNLKLWYPCSDTGNIMSERIVGADITDANTCEHDIPHALGMGTNANMSVPNMANAKIPRKGMCLAVVNVGSIFALINIYLGHSNGTHILLAGAGVSVSIADGVSVGGITGASGPAAGNYMVLACAWDETNLYTYLGEAADATLVDTDALPANVIASLPKTFAPNGQINGAGTESDMYGIALFDFTANGLPDDLVVGMNWMKDHWIKGDKVIYPEWKDL